jgi:hypothetical protein
MCSNIPEDGIPRALFEARGVRGSVVFEAYSTSRKFAGSRPDEVNDYLSIYPILLAALGPGVYSASNRHEYQKHKKYFLGGSKAAAGA